MRAVQVTSSDGQTTVDAQYGYGQWQVNHISGAPFNGFLWGGSAGSHGVCFLGLVRNFSGRYLLGGRDMNAVLVALGAGGR